MLYLLESSRVKMFWNLETIHVSSNLSILRKFILVQEMFLLYFSLSCLTSFFTENTNAFSLPVILEDFLLNNVSCSTARSAFHYFLVYQLLSALHLS